MEYTIRGRSMDGYYDEGDVIQVSSDIDIINRFDHILYGNLGRTILKEVVGIPGDKFYVENKVLYIDGVDGCVIYRTCNSMVIQEFSRCYSGILPNENYIVLGTIGSLSWDSRNHGPILKESIIGKVIHA